MTCIAHRLRNLSNIRYSNMEITEIPFHKLLKIKKSNKSDGVLELTFCENKQNHIGTFHASAQFALAEATSGFALQQAFPQLVSSVIPILRKADTKFKKPAEFDISAYATIDHAQKEQFLEKIDSKGRATISVLVEVKDQKETVTMVGNYQWYIQKI